MSHSKETLEDNQDLVSTAFEYAYRIESLVAASNLLSSAASICKFDQPIIDSNLYISDFFNNAFVDRQRYRERNKDINLLMPERFAENPGDILWDEENQMPADANKIFYLLSKYPHSDIHIGHCLHVLNALQNHELSHNQRIHLGKHALYLCGQIARSYEQPNLICALEYHGMKACDDDALQFALETVKNTICAFNPMQVLQSQVGLISSAIAQEDVEYTVNSRVKGLWAMVRKVIAGRSPHDFFGHTIIIKDIPHIIDPEQISKWIHENVVCKLTDQGFSAVIEPGDDTFLEPRADDPKFKVVKLVAKDKYRIPCEIQITTELQARQNRESHVIYKLHEQDNRRYGRYLPVVIKLRDFTLRQTLGSPRRLDRNSTIFTTPGGNHSFPLDGVSNESFDEIMNKINPKLKAITKYIRIRHGDSEITIDLKSPDIGAQQIKGIISVEFLDSTKQRLLSHDDILKALLDKDNSGYTELCRQYPLLTPELLRPYSFIFQSIVDKRRHAQILLAKAKYSDTELRGQLQKDIADIESEFTEILSELKAISIRREFYDWLRTGEIDISTRDLKRFRSGLSQSLVSGHTTSPVFQLLDDISQLHSHSWEFLFGHIDDTKRFRPSALPKILQILDTLPEHSTAQSKVIKSISNAIATNSTFNTLILADWNITIERFQTPDQQIDNFQLDALIQAYPKVVFAYQSLRRCTRTIARHIDNSQDSRYKAAIRMKKHFTKLLSQSLAISDIPSNEQ